MRRSVSALGMLPVTARQSLGSSSGILCPCGHPADSLSLASCGRTPHAVAVPQMLSLIISRRWRLRHPTCHIIYYTKGVHPRLHNGSALGYMDCHTLPRGKSTHALGQYERLPRSRAERAERQEWSSALLAAAPMSRGNMISE
jgi:hypothetical protein